MSGAARPPLPPGLVGGMGGASAGVGGRGGAASTSSQPAATPLVCTKDLVADDNRPRRMWVALHACMGMSGYQWPQFRELLHKETACSLLAIFLFCTGKGTETNPYGIMHAARTTESELRIHLRCVCCASALCHVQPADSLRGADPAGDCQVRCVPCT
jgi:hypothetical protein